MADTKNQAKTTSESAVARVLYRKYRPTRLEDVVGQEQITSVLKNSLEQGKLAHAYLFIGPRGTGKTSVARIFAHAVNGFEYHVEDHYLDIIEIDAASNTGVDNIRELREKAVIAPTKGKYKVYIIDEVHMLTKSASNALLKTLEEPPAHVIFIMATTDAHKVPITISSRTQVHTFRLAPPEVMQAHLRKIADTENIKITDGALKILTRRGGGSFRDSLSLLDQITNLTIDEITAEILEKALGLPAEQTITELLEAEQSGDNAKIHQLLKELLNTGIKPEILAGEMLERIMERPEPALLPLLAKLPEVQPPFPEAKLLLALLTNDGTSAQSPSRALQSATPEKAPSEQALAPKPAKTPSPQPTTKIAPKPQKTSTDANGQFDWEGFIAAVEQDNAAIATQLRKTNYEYNDNTLHIYPSQGFVKKILEKSGNRQILTSHLGTINLILHDVGEQKLPEDSQISQISAIMGGVQEVKGDLPF